MSVTSIEIQVPTGVFAALRCSPQDFGAELRLAAAVKWYELGMVSQGRAAEIAGLSRADFIDALGRFGVTAFQVSADELEQEVLGV